jgi:hypothetical protein
MDSVLTFILAALSPRSLNRALDENLFKTLWKPSCSLNWWVIALINCLCGNLVLVLPKILSRWSFCTRPYDETLLPSRSGQLFF